ncbi:MAG: Gldg family protein [Candidatus Binatia bacterium]|nr:Gldg family protein [Candidatus Binatia bacterium]
MRPSSSLLGLVGALALFFGVTSYFLVGELEAYSIAHLAIGAVLLLIYLVSSFRDLGALLSARSTRYGANMVVYSVLFIALLAGINWLGVRYNQRIDLTEEGVFTLSPQARTVLESIDRELEFQAFLEGGRNPAVENTMRSFSTVSPLVVVKLIDPDQQPELTQKYGVRTYGSVRVQYGEQATTVEQPTEEALTNALIKVTRAKTQVVYFVQGEGEPNIDDVENADGYGQLKADLQNEQYQVEPLVLLQESAVPDDCDVLAIAAPLRPLLDHEVEAIRAYLDGGGHAVFLLPPQTGSALGPLLTDYGIELGDDVVVDQVVRVFQGPTLGLNPMVETYGPHPITQDIRERTIFPLTRSVTPTETPEGLTVTSIAKTSPSSWAESDLDTLFEQSQASLDEADIAGPISIGVAATADRKALGSGEGQTRLVVYGTAAVADNQHINMLFNRDLVLNSFGWLGGQEELVAIRPRTVRSSRVQFSREEASTIFYLSVLIVPELLMVLGLAVWWRRSAL